MFIGSWIDDVQQVAIESADWGNLLQVLGSL